MDKKYDIERNRIIICGPEVGKEDLQRQYANIFVDGDNICRSINKDFFKERKLHKDDKPYNQDFDRKYLNNCLESLDRGRVLLLSYVPKDTKKTLNKYLVNNKIPLLVWRDSPKDIYDSIILKNELANITLQDVDKWFNNSKEWAKRIAKDVVWLEKGKTIQDILEWK